MNITAKQFWGRVVWGPPDRVPSVLCSFCADRLPHVPLMLSMDDGHVARFCDRCAEAVMRFTKPVMR